MSQNHVRTWSYDTHGNLLSTTDPLNNTISFTVDSLGYPLTMTQPAPNNATGTVTTTYTRDSYERLTKSPGQIALSAPSGTIRSTIRHRLRMKTITRPPQTSMPSAA